MLKLQEKGRRARVFDPGVILSRYATDTSIYDTKAGRLQLIKNKQLQWVSTTKYYTMLSLYKCQSVHP